MEATINIEDYLSEEETEEFLAFHSAGQRDLFLAENERLVKDYLMID